VIPTMQTASASLYLAEAMSVLRNLAPGSVDATVTDPPYSSGGLFRGDRQRPTGEKYQQSKYRHLHTDFTGDSRDQRSYGYWCTLWLAECLRVTRPGGFLLMFTDWRQLPISTDAIQAAGWLWRGIVPWDKTEAVRPQSGRFRNQAEYILWASAGALPQQGPVVPGVFRHRVDMAKKHMTAKPVALMRDLLQPCGEVILDPFMGSGSTGVAAIQTGRQFVGSEQHPGIFDTAREQIELADSQAPLSLGDEQGALELEPAAA
jgi:site-specific DNA-methyltransferase (adenine-specific)